MKPNYWASMMMEHKLSEHASQMKEMLESQAILFASELKKVAGVRAPRTKWVRYILFFIR